MSLRTSLDMVEAFRYKLRKFSVNMEGPADIYCVNNSVVENSSVTESVLNKRHNDICHHNFREA